MPPNSTPTHLAGGHHRNHDLDLLVHADFIEVQVQAGLGNGMLLHLFDHHVVLAIDTFDFQFEAVSGPQHRI
jgi:hypothetical protein